MIGPPVPVLAWHLRQAREGRHHAEQAPVAQGKIP